jgi:hypothetical protein
MVQFMAWKNISLLKNIQTGSGAHPNSYSVGTGGSFPAVKAAAWNCTPLSHMPFWHGAPFYYFCLHCKNMQNLSVYAVWQKSLQIKVLNHDQCIFIV